MRSHFAHFAYFVFSVVPLLLFVLVFSFALPAEATHEYSCSYVCPSECSGAVDFCASTDGSGSSVSCGSYPDGSSCGTSYVSCSPSSTCGVHDGGGDTGGGTGGECTCTFEGTGSGDCREVNNSCSGYNMVGDANCVPSSGCDTYSYPYPYPYPTPYHTFSVSKNGDGSGTVAGDGISCGSTCSRDYREGTIVNIGASGGTGVFMQWSGACGGTSSGCAVAMSTNKSATATFTKPTFRLTKEAPAGIYGTGIVTMSTSSSGAGFVCDAGNETSLGLVSNPNCLTDSSKVYRNETITLRARSERASNLTTYHYDGTGVFVRWEGYGCNGSTNRDCTFSMNANQSAMTRSTHAVFERPTITVDKVTSTAATGTVEMQLDEENPEKDPDELALVPSESIFERLASYVSRHVSSVSSAVAGWAGGVVESVESVLAGAYGPATLARASQSLDGIRVATYGYPYPYPYPYPTPYGYPYPYPYPYPTPYVYPYPYPYPYPTPAAPIYTCGSECVHRYDFKDVITLRAIEDGSGYFAGWSGGGCSGNSLICNVTLDNFKTVEARFERPLLTLSKLIASSSGRGVMETVEIGLNNGITCGLSCSSSSDRFPYRDTITVEATPDANTASVLHRWISTDSDYTCSNTVQNTTSNITCDVPMDHPTETLGADFRNFDITTSDAEDVLATGVHFEGSIQVYNEAYNIPTDLYFVVWKESEAPAQCDTSGMMIGADQTGNHFSNGTHTFSATIGVEGDETVRLEQNTDYVYCAVGEQNNGTVVTKYGGFSNSFHTLIRPEYEEF